MNVKLLSLELTNFKGVKNAKYEFGNRTKISGANATGKTTLFDAYTWLLFNKDSLDNEKFSIRPLDKDGKQIDNVEIKVVANFLIDGKEMEFSKTQKQKWVKRRGTDVTELQGNENLYEIDGYPKSEKEFKERIADIVAEELFKLLTTPTYFASLKWQDRREILMRFVKDICDYDLARENPKFAGLIDELQKAPSTDDIKKKYQKALTEWKKKQSEIPVRIDELKKSRVDIDVSELELGKKAIAELIKSNKEKQDDVSKQYEEYQNLSDGVLQLQFELNDLQRKANEENNRNRREIEDKISDKRFLLRQTEKTISDFEKNIELAQYGVDLQTKHLNASREEWKSENGRVFAENGLICSYCGQEYPIEKKEQLRADFESHKAEELKRITLIGNKAKEDLEKEKETLAKLEKELPQHKESLEMLNSAIADLEKQLSEIPQSIDISDREDVKAIKEQIAEKEKAMQIGNSANEIRSQLKCELEELQAQYNEFDRQIAKAENNVAIDERISELQSEQREVAQKVADQEKMMFLLEEFIHYKMDKVSETINNQFDGISFKLFEMQLNGGMKECCEVTVNGVPYGSLNAGHRIVAGLQIIKALQKLYEVKMPVFIDNAESVNDFNIPDMDCQLVMMAVSEDKELKVEVA